MTIEFPADAQGKRSSTLAGTKIVAAALEVLNPDWAAQARSETHWRRNYPLHFHRLVEGGLASSQAALSSAQAGLDEAWRQFQLSEVTAPTLAINSHTFAFDQTLAQAPWQVPYRGKMLEGQALKDQIEKWVQANIMEPTAAQALSACMDHPEWFDLSDRHLVLLGAGSEAGPLTWLLKWRANICAVDLARPAIWERIAALAAKGNAKVIAPMQQGVLGVDLLKDTHAIAKWLTGVHPQLDIAAHAYADGEAHVRVVMACDLIQQQVRQHSSVATSFAFMATPTDIFAIPKNAALASQKAFESRPLLSRGLQKSLKLASGEKFFQANITGLVNGYGVADSLVLEQGPNYALAKRMQQWRAIVSHAQGIKVSLNVAPSTTTSSVVKNPALAAGFAGADTFGMEVFEPDTTNALMAAIWVHDLRTQAPEFAHPYELMMRSANHGGLWTCAYRPRSALPFAAALGWIRNKTR